MDTQHQKLGQVSGFSHRYSIDSAEGQNKGQTDRGAPDKGQKDDPQEHPES